ncbi:MAG: DUF6670 family protein, partial [Mycobacteriaceae bacterium]
MLTTVVGDRLAQLLIKGLRTFNRGARLSTQPFSNPGCLVPHTSVKGYAWTHNGIMIAGLPDPLRFLSITTVVGTPGVIVADPVTSPPPSGPRDCANIQISTAATAPGFTRDYAISSECEFRPDGSLWRYGPNLTIAGDYPHYTVTAAANDLHVQLELDCTDVVTWFVKTPVYRHLSLLTRYSGTISLGDTRYEISGLCTFEHGTAMSGYSLTRRMLPTFLKVPLDFFTYQVLELHEGAQLLLTATESRGHQVLTGAYLRTVDGRSVAIDRDVSFEVLQYRDTPAITPDGLPMTLPQRIRWHTPADSALPIDLEGEVDTAFNYGLGNGYVGGYSFTGTVDGRSYDCSSGYIEYIDRRTRAAPA